LLEIILLVMNEVRLELSLVSALKAFEDDPNTYTYLFQKSNFAGTVESAARIPDSNSLSQFNLVRANTVS
jgi:hypothetical protein